MYYVQSTAKSTFSGGEGGGGLEASRFDITHKSAREDAKSVYESILLGMNRYCWDPGSYKAFSFACVPTGCAALLVL